MIFLLLLLLFKLLKGFQSEAGFRYGELFHISHCSKSSRSAQRHGKLLVDIIKDCKK